MQRQASGEQSPVNARLRSCPALLPCSRALPGLAAAALPGEPGEAPASKSAGSRPAPDDSACGWRAAASVPRCTPVMPSASWAVGAQSTCSRVLPCIAPAYIIYLDLAEPCIVQVDPVAHQWDSAVFGIMLVYKDAGYLDNSQLCEENSAERQRSSYRHLSTCRMMWAWQVSWIYIHNAGN